MKSTGSGEHQSTSTAEVNTGFQERSGNQAETLGRMSLALYPISHPKRARVAMLEQETRSAIIDQAIEDGKIVDWMPRLNHNETSIPATTDHMGAE